MVLNSTINPALKIVLRFIGAWPDVPYTFVNKAIFTLAWLTIQYFQYLNVIAQCKLGEVQKLVDSMPATICYSLTNVKLIAL